MTDTDPDPERLLPGFVAESELERSLIADQSVRRGLAWGAARPGHPEGTVAHHVTNMLSHVARDDPDRAALRALTLIHDAGKRFVVRSTTWTPDSDHALIARRLLGAHTDDERLLDAVELHDAPYWRWKTGRAGDGILPKGRDVDLPLFVRFVELDASTEGKDVSFLWWFRRMTAEVQLPAGGDWTRAPLIDRDTAYVYVKSLAVDPGRQRAVADALWTVAADFADSMRAEFDVLSSEDGLRTLLLWRWRGDTVGRLLRDGEVVRRGLRAHAALREAEAIDARMYLLAEPRGSHLWQPA